MMEQIRQFFRRLFGMSEEAGETATTNHTSQETSTEESDRPEDAADLMMQEILSMDETEAPPVSPSTMKTRGIGVGGNIEVFEANDLTMVDSAPPITITSPKYLWCLDNGHGRLQDGKRSPIFDDGVTRFEEWEFNRDIVRRIVAQIEDIGVQFFVVVPEDDIGSFTRGRSERANERESPLGLPKIFLSIHSNAASSGVWNDGVTGIETWHFPNSDKGSRISGAFQRALMAEFPDWADRGTRNHQPGSGKIFTVLQVPKMPSVLTENGYYTDRVQAADLMKDEIRQRIANAHVAAILAVEEAGIENIQPYHKRMVIA